VAGAVPIVLICHISPLDAVFEATSGFTTTGYTVLTGLDDLPRSLLLWRAISQWVGGVGILSFFLLISFPGGEAYRLLMMEGAKTLVQRPVPGVRGTLLIVGRIYLILTALNFVALLALGVGPFDAVAHAMTTISTGGFSTHDANLAFYRDSGHPAAAAIELVTIVFMLASGINFLIYHLMMRGRLSEYLFGLETRAYWRLLFLGVGMAVAETLLHPDAVPWGGEGAWVRAFRYGLFQSASSISGAGFVVEPLTRWIALPATYQLLLGMMFIGGCVGSTTGGLKLLRVVILWRFTWHQIRRSTYPSRYVMPFLVGRRAVPDEEVGRMTMLAFCWLALVALGAILTCLLGGVGAQPSFVMSLSSVSNMGPCLFRPTEIAALGGAVKVLHMLLMIAGRLEILPLLALLCRALWRGTPTP
jgi:trk system potassium uptake protein TrkH